MHILINTSWRHVGRYQRNTQRTMQFSDLLYLLVPTVMGSAIDAQHDFRRFCPQEHGVAKYQTLNMSATNGKASYFD